MNGSGAAAVRGQGAPRRRYVPLGGPAWPFAVGLSSGGRERFQRPADHLQGELGGGAERGAAAGDGRRGGWYPGPGGLCPGPAGSGAWALWNSELFNMHSNQCSPLSFPLFRLLFPVLNSILHALFFRMLIHKDLLSKFLVFTGFGFVPWTEFTGCWGF